jgi:hypothetical protein
MRLSAMMYVRYPLSLRNVKDLLHERGVDITHEAVWFWCNRLGTIFAAEIRRSRVSAMRIFRHRRWHLDEKHCQQNKRPLSGNASSLLEGGSGALSGQLCGRSQHNSNFGKSASTNLRAIQRANPRADQHFKWCLMRVIAASEAAVEYPRSPWIRISEMAPSVRSQIARANSFGRAVPERSSSSAKHFSN